VTAVEPDTLYGFSTPPDHHVLEAPAGAEFRDLPGRSLGGPRSGEKGFLDKAGHLM